MHTQAIDLKEFYDSLRGRVVQRILRRHLRRLWPSVSGQRVIGIGYALPFLKPLIGEAERVAALMPFQQGAVAWPQDEPGLCALCDETELPIETNSVDKILVIHGLSSAESLDATLRECWRVLTGQGRLIVIVPNRAGIWARWDNTPFGHGMPYSVGQLRSALRNYMFVPETVERGLFVPPFSSRLMLATAPAWENLGQRFFNAFGGVNIVEASKQLYAGTLAHATTPEAAAVVRKRVIAAARPLSRARQQKS